MRWTLPLAFGLVAVVAQPATLTLELRVFLAGEEVTGETRVTLHRAGDRSVVLPPDQRHEGRHVYTVGAGIYDAQVVRERDGRVLNIRWAERMVVMPYPDEGGRHLEVVNFQSGYGALQVKPRPDAPTELALFPAGERTRATTAPPVPSRPGDDYILFVLPAARYDVQVKSGPRPTWHPGLEVPLDRTRLWLIP